MAPYPHLCSCIVWTVLHIYLFNICASTPIPQSAPYTCGQGLNSVNGQCMPNVIAPIPLAPASPCAAGSASYTNVIAPVASVVTQPCTQVAQPCPLTQPWQATQPCQTAVTLPGPMPVVYPQPIIYPGPPMTATPPTTTPPIPPPTTTTTQRPPAPIIDKRCPPGTILIYDYCHLIYCGSGIYRDGKCIITVCPGGTIWTGSRCQQPEPQNQTSVYISNVINTNVDHTSDNHVINYINNLVINVTESPIVTPPPPSPPPVELSSTPLPPSNCCYIITPQTCFWEGDQYQCESRKYRRCGSICTAPYISLRPPTDMPLLPPPQPCQSHQCEPFYPDCNTCDNMTEPSCQRYCQRPTCQANRCQQVDLRGYCESSPGAMGCRRTDGCMNDWCY